jgi:hypothetical protein
VTEIDYHARLAWLQERRNDGLVSWLEGDPEAHDPKAAGWWLYVTACAIGDPWRGPWRVVDGRLTKVGAGGVTRALPHLGCAGRGIKRGLPHLGNAGQGVNRAHDDLTNYLTQLANRLQHVRITCGDWQRVTNPSVHRAGAGGDGTRAIFLDPPYATSGTVYAHGDNNGDLSAAVRQWCATAPAHLRIVLAGYDTEHDDLLAHGWTKQHGKAGGRGYNTDTTNARRERLWLSPACITTGQTALWETA